MTKSVLVIVGTRPEVIKMAPVILALRGWPEEVSCRLVLTGQHEALAEDMARMYALNVDYRLHEMRPNDTLPQLVARMTGDIADVLAEDRPDLVLVHGDTATTFTAALAAFYARIPVGHVEAGLRTYDLDNPFPEEANRSLVARLATLHFAPTKTARDALVREGVPPQNVVVTGNTVVDSVLLAQQQVDEGGEVNLPPLTASRVMLVTMHRRESWGDGIAQICHGVRRIVTEHPDLEVVLPVHPGPIVHDMVMAELSGLPRLHLTPPMDYRSLVALLSRCHLVLTDSGGLQEEAMSLRKPVLVMRQMTERQEAIEAGGAMLVGTNGDHIAGQVGGLLASTRHYDKMANVRNPFGDGRAGERIAQIVYRFLTNGTPRGVAGAP